MSDDSQSLLNLHDTILLENNEDVSPATAQEPTTLVISHEDHARIYPINDAARKAFHEIATIVQADQGWNPHVRRFMHIDKAAVADDASEPSSSDEENGKPDDAKPNLTGYYRLNLAILPKKFANGWILGAGRNRPTDADVDILVSINGHRDNVRTRHARILYHQESRAPMVGALPKKAILLNGQEIKEQAHVLSQTQGLVVGNLAYRLEFLPIDKTRYIRALDMILTRTRRWSHGNHSSFDPTPSNNHFELHGYQFQTPQAAGSYGVVSACLQVSTGALYAVKRVQRTMKSFGLVNTEVLVMKKLSKHPHVCSLVDTLYSDGDGVSMGSRSVNDVYMILSPWAPSSLADFVATRPNRDLLMSAYHQGAQGIRHLHRSNIIHRDIKPSNVLITTFDPLRVVVADFGHATFAPDNEAYHNKHPKDLKDHMKGTISYLAPEINALKDGASASGYWTKASDVFTYGVIGTELLHGKVSRSKVRHCIDVHVHKQLLSKLNVASAMDDLLMCMMEWRYSDRPTMDQILLKSVWPIYETPNSTVKRKNIHDL